MTRSTNMEHVEVLQRMANESWHRSPELSALVAAIAALSAPQPPAEAQACGCGKPACVEPWEPGCDLGKSEQHAVVQAQSVGEVLSRIEGKLREAGARLPAPPVKGTIESAVVTGLSIALAVVEAEAAPPSAPVGVEGHEAIAEHCARAVAKLRGRESIHAPTYNAAKRGALTALKTVAALAQQPAPVAPVGVEGFVVRHYTEDEGPTIKGNGFDGLRIGEDRDEAEEFIHWVNAALAQQPADEVPKKPSWYAERLPQTMGELNESCAYVSALAQQPAAVDEVRERLVECRDWFDQQADTISKGGGSTWDLLQCREQRDLCDAALAAQPGGSDNDR